MKKLVLFLVVFALALIGPVMAADHYNAGTIAVYESNTQITYVWTFTCPLDGDSTGSWHSRPMYIADCNAVDGYVYSNGTAGTGTEDANIIYHFSPDDRTTWWSTTPADLDAQGGVAKTDTIGINSGTNDIYFHASRWLVVEYDGQTGNESNRLYTYVVTMTKDLTMSDNAGGYVKMGRYATGNSTNP